MSATRLLARAIISNWISFGVQIACAFVLTPFVLRSIGVEAYGIWSVAVGLAGYYGLLDLGIRSGVTQIIARDHAAGDQAKVNDTISTAVAALAVVGAAAAVATLFLSSRVPVWFGIAASQATTAERAMLLLGLAFSSQFVFFPFSAVLTAMQRFDVEKGIGVATRLVTAAATLWLLSNGGGLEGLAAITVAGYLGDYALRASAAYWLMPELKVRPARASIEAMRRLAGSGVWNVVIIGSTRLISYSDIIVIGAYLGAAATTPFALAVNVVNYFGQMVIPVEIFFPAVARLDVRGDGERLRDLFIRASRLTVALVALSVTAASVWATDFYRLWLGPSFDPATPTIFRILLAATVFTVWTRLGTQVLLGKGRARTVALLVGAEAATNFALSLWLVRVAGLIGVAIGTLVPAIIFGLVIWPIVVSRVVRLPVAQYYRSVVLGPSFAAIAIASILVPYRHAVIPVSWLSLVVSGVFTAVVIAALLLVVAPEIRRRLIQSASDRFAGVTQERDTVRPPAGVSDFAS